jgi:hypothetical protein
MAQERQDWVSPPPEPTEAVLGAITAQRSAPSGRRFLRCRRRSALPPFQGVQNILDRADDGTRQHAHDGNLDDQIFDLHVMIPFMAPRVTAASSSRDGSRAIR